MNDRTDTDKNDTNVNDRNTNPTHSPLFQKIIQARVAAGYTESQKNTLNSEELQAVNTLRAEDVPLGEKITINNHGSQEVFVKG